MSGHEYTAVQATNDRATQSKLHATRKGYFRDDFIRHFCHEAANFTPEINRGYFYRTETFRCYSFDFVKANSGNCQIVNLGAGSDTLFFKMHQSDFLPSKYIEVDLPENVYHKVQRITRVPVLRKFFPAANFTTPQQPSHAVRFDCGHNFHLIPFDLNSDPGQLIRMLVDSPVGLDLSLPTLFLSECVLVYLNPEASARLLQEISRQFPRASFLSYEQVNINDRFGTIMRENFAKSGCDLPGLVECVSVQSQQSRFQNQGWQSTACWTMLEVASSLFPAGVIQRVNALELMDETETLTQLFSHYCILLAGNFADFQPDLAQALAQFAC